MAYIRESSSVWQRRRRRRAAITLLVVLVLLVGAGGVGYGIYRGWFGSGGGSVDVAALPPCPVRPKTRPALTPSAVTVNVYNATTRDGLASATAAGMRARGFVIGKIRNDPLSADVRGSAVVRYGPAGAAAAKLVAGQVKGAKLVKDRRRSAVVDLVVGRTYTALAPVTQALPAAKATASAAPTCRPVTPTPPVGLTPTGKNVTPPPTPTR